MIKKFKIFENDDRYKIRTKNLTVIDEDEFILFKLKKELNFHSLVPVRHYHTDELYIAHLYNIEIRPELHVQISTGKNLLFFIKAYKPTVSLESTYRDVPKNVLTNMQFKLMLRQMEIYERGTLNDIVEKLKELDMYNKYNL